MRARYFDRSGAQMAVTMDAPVRGQNDLGHYWSMVSSRKLLVTAATFLGILVALGYLYVTPSSYTASTTVMVYPLTTDRFAANRNISNLVDMNSEAVLASSFRVAETAAESAGAGWMASDLRESTTVSAGADSATMTIRVEAGSEDLARSGAAAVADAYIDTRSEQAMTSISNLVARDQERIEEYRSQLADAVALGDAASPGSATATRALADQQLLDQQISVVLARISGLEGIDTTGGAVLNPASMTRVVESPSRTSTIAAGAAMGLVVGLVGAFVIPLGPKRVRGMSDIRRSLGVVDFVEFSTPDVAIREIPAATQRLLRSAVLADAKIIAFVCDDAVLWSGTVVELFADEMTASGTNTTVASPSGTGGADVMMLLPLSPDATLGERLHAFRVSDAVVLVAQRKVSRVRNLQRFAHDAAEMGSKVIGIVLVSGDDQEWDGEERRESRAILSRRTSLRGASGVSRGQGGGGQ